jgi:hypothetical protein
MSRIAARSDIGDAIARRADGGSAMRKLISFMVTTLDGFTEGPNGEFRLDQCRRGVYEFSISQLGKCAADVRAAGQVIRRSNG